MYLKSIEMHGFKSFAGRIVLSFDDGITGIVGPNGSGKSNVSDAVRWVLGEQSAKTLRGSNMQDVIFSGTESRKALSFAYVCITLDNSDHVLPLEFDEVSVSRRIYSSGESEYQINKANCRLKDIQELFYDTGIGKEGYSIIGQGQIEKILSSKPEDRRELFDEAVGIVKYKKRKEASLKRLQEEEDNLARIEDVLSEITGRIEPLKKQAEAAREYLSYKERQKSLDINLFLIESGQTSGEEERLKEAKESLLSELSKLREENESNTQKYGAFSKSLRELDDHIEEMRQTERDSSGKKGELGSEIMVLRERISSAEGQLLDLAKREETLVLELSSRQEEMEKLSLQCKEDENILSEVEDRVKKAREYSSELSNRIRTINSRIEELNKGLLSLRDERIEINNERQKFDTRIESLNIQKASLNQRQLELGTQKEQLAREMAQADEAFKKQEGIHKKLVEDEQALNEKLSGLRDKIKNAREACEDKKRSLASLRTKRETIKNIAERYEGYGGAVRHIMQASDDLDGVIGVVADLFRADKKHETAIETALGAAIQNIVTKDEPSARKCIEFLKANRHGRATFLPLTSVKGGEEFRFSDALNEPGVIGLASTLVRCDDRYKGICEMLLGRIVVADNMDAAIPLAKKFKYRLNIVTLEGEQLRPGGSITGGAYRSNSNLLGRSRELEELLDEIKSVEADIDEGERKISEYSTARDLINDDLSENSEKTNESAILLNTLSINVSSIRERMEELSHSGEDLKSERSNIEEEVLALTVKKEETALLLSNSEAKQSEMEDEIAKLQTEADESTYMEDTAIRNLSEIQIEEANARSEASHARENMERLTLETEKIHAEIEEATERKQSLSDEIKENGGKIEQITEEIKKNDASYEELLIKIEEANEKKEEMKKQNRQFLDTRDSLTAQIGNLEKEEIRLDGQMERITGERQRLSDHIWQEYELTYHNALEYRSEELSDTALIRKELSDIAQHIRDLGNVNVNAIEEYAEVSERYEFLTNQCEDLREGRTKLLGIIEDLNIQMKERFEKGFAEISREFDTVFKELFGGGSGTLKLADDKDILGSGISIVAQPPGKKLSNIMQMSGGEKALVAICILFAILNLKPSPFCLLDEIEAALDEPNVDRFAKYLNKLTENTQFIIITHRRGTMNAADRLYGITMQEKGISALVSVSLIEDELE